MQSLFKHLVLIQVVLFSALYSPSYAQQDSLISFEGLEFTDGSIDETGDTLVEVPEDLIFDDGTATVAEESEATDAPVQHVDASGTEKQSLWGIFIAG